MEALIAFVIGLAISGGIGYLIGKGKGRGTAGFWWGFLLGIIGWIVAACLAPSLDYEVKKARAINDATR